MSPTSTARHPSILRKVVLCSAAVVVTLLPTACGAAYAADSTHTGHTGVVKVAGGTTAEPTAKPTADKQDAGADETATEDKSGADETAQESGDSAQQGEKDGKAADETASAKKGKKTPGGSTEAAGAACAAGCRCGS